jgi:hypothetical protein
LPAVAALKVMRAESTEIKKLNLSLSEDFIVDPSDSFI